jgi:hypothetical protein
VLVDYLEVLLLGLVVELGLVVVVELEKGVVA